MRMLQPDSVDSGMEHTQQVSSQQVWLTGQLALSAILLSTHIGHMNWMGNTNMTEYDLLAACDPLHSISPIKPALSLTH